MGVGRCCACVDGSAARGVQAFALPHDPHPYPSPQGGGERKGNGKRYALSLLLFCRLNTRSSTTARSAKVEVSPRLPNSSSVKPGHTNRKLLL